MKKLKTTNSPSVILKLKNIKPNSKITLFNIAHCIKLKWTLSQGLLAEMGGMSERTINRCLNELEENGYIKRDTKLFNGKGKETSYTIIWDSITKYAKEYEWYDDKNSNTVDLSPTNNEDIPTPQPIEEKPVEAMEIAIEEDFITDEDKYGKTVMDFIDKYEDKVIPALNAITEYYHLKNEDYRTLALGANDLINNCMNEYGLIGDDVKKLEIFTWDYQKEMVKDRKNKQFNAA